MERCFGKFNHGCGTGFDHRRLCTARRRKTAGTRVPEGSRGYCRKTGIDASTDGVSMAIDEEVGVLVRSENESHLKQNLETPALIDVLTAKDWVAIEAISSPAGEGSEEKLCWDRGQSSNTKRQATMQRSEFPCCGKPA